MVDHLVECDISVFIEPCEPLLLEICGQCPHLRWPTTWCPLHAFKFLKSKPSQMETLHECADPFRINLHVGSEYRESVPKLLQQMVKRAKYVLKRKPVNGRDIVIEFIVTKGVFTEPGINLICCRVSVRDAGYSPSVILHRLNAPQKLRDNDAGLSAPGARYKTHVAGLCDGIALFTR